MIHFFRHLAAGFSAIFLTAHAHAQFGLDDPMGEENETTQAIFVAETSSIAPGEAFTVALQLNHPDEWHSYYENTGGVEEPLSIRWELPEGFTAGPIQWPTPKAKEGYFGMSYIYEGSPTFLVDITAPASAKIDETVTLTAWPTWQICKQTCINEPNPERSFEIQLPVEDQAKPDPSTQKLFATARAAQPSPSDRFEISASFVGEFVEVRLTPKTGDDTDLASVGLDFIPDSPYVLGLSSETSQLEKDGNDWLLKLGTLKETITGDAIPKPESLNGILIAKEGFGSGLRIPETAFTKAPVPPLPFSKFLPVLGGMLLGGLILNLMPCVFPVIGLKIMGFVQQAGEDRKKIILHGMTFTLGVLISFAILSGILFVVRESSTADISWGYQLQNKWFVYGLVMLFWVFGLSMFGLFELGTSATAVGGSLQSKSGLTGSFFSGVLATVAATPCSAPFLGPAIGLAVTLPAAQFFAAFAAMGIGLSLPYLVLSSFPKLVDFLPRPGAWMESFKQGMAFLLIGTAAYFLWVYMEHIVDEVLYLVFMGFVLIAMAAWVFGRWTTPSKTIRTRWIGRVTALLLLGSGVYLTTGPYAGLKWENWSNSRVEELLEKEQPVYVDFTAKWCATCQVNKKTAYDERVVKLFKELNIAALKADKTLPNPEIDRAVAQLGREAIPVNVLYVPNKEPIVTPEILTADYLLELFTKEIPE